jgi:hypothetical protein
MYNLTDSQKDLLHWLVQQVRNGNLLEEFIIIWVSNNEVIIPDYKDGSNIDIPNLTKSAFDALATAGLILCNVSYDTKVTSSGAHQQERNRRCTLLGKAYEAVDTDFSAPDTSFIKYLTPLADITNLDSEIKQRCLPILGAGSTDPKLWDSVVRTPGILL